MTQPPASTWFAVTGSAVNLINSSTQCHSGNWCGSMTLAPSDSQTSIFWQWLPSGTLPTTGFYMQMWVNFPTTWQWNIDGDHKLFILDPSDNDAGGARFYLNVRTNGTTQHCGSLAALTDAYNAWVYYNQAGTDPGICADGNWHSIQAYLNESSGQLEVWLDGNAYINTTPSGFYGNKSAYNSIKFGAYMNDAAASTTGGNRTFYVDDICVSTTPCSSSSSTTSNSSASSAAPVVSPTSATVAVGGTQQFSANAAVSWSVNGVTGGNSAVGTITSAGLYSAPAAVPSTSVTVVATETSNSVPSAPATITITAASGTSTQTTLFGPESWASGTWSDWGGGTPAGMSLSTTNVINGASHSAYVQHVSGTANSAWAETYFGDLDSTGPQQTEVTQEFDSYFDPNASINVAGGGGTKITILICNQDWTSIYPQPLAFSPFYLTMYADPTFNLWGELHRKTVTPDVWQEFGQNVGTSNPIALGKWQHVKVHAKLNTPGNSDGVLEVWLNGVQTMEYTNVDFRDSYTTRGWNMFEITGYDNAAPSTTWNQYWDNINLYVP